MLITEQYLRLLIALVNRDPGEVIEFDDSEISSIPPETCLSVDSDSSTHRVTIRVHKPGAQLHILPPSEPSRPVVNINERDHTKWQNSRTPLPKSDAELAALEALSAARRADRAAASTPRRSLRPELFSR